MSFFSGSSEKHRRVPTLLPQQMGNFNQLQSAGSGAFGQASDYYKDLLSNDSQTANQMMAPEMRRFNEQIMPQLSEQFAGMGSGGLSSGSFRNAAVNAGTDLSERLGAIRAQLRNQGAQGLQNIGQFSLGNFSQDVMTQPGTEGFLSQMAPAIGTAIGSFGGPIGSAIGGGIGSMFGGSSTKGKSTPYGGMSKVPGAMTSGNFNLPTFMGR